MKRKTAAYLESFGIRPSLQRIAIMDYLLENKVHPTADQVYLSLIGSMPTLSKMTVYNTLQLFAKSGAVLSLGVDPRHRRFDGDTTVHGHFICNQCGKVEDVMYSQQQIDMVISTMPQRANAAVEVTYTGLCASCEHMAH